jgi:hypothetical protein
MTAYAMLAKITDIRREPRRTVLPDEALDELERCVAHPRQPLSMVSACPRPFISTNSVMLGLSSCVFL